MAQKSYVGLLELSIKIFWDGVQNSVKRLQLRYFGYVWTGNEGVEDSRQMYI